MPTFTVAVIAGGKSTRMGTDKALIPLLGRPMIEHVMERISDLGQAETLLVTDQRATLSHLGVSIIEDTIPNKGSLGGLYSAIHHSRTEYTLTVACDMPFLNSDLLRYMVALCAGPFDVIVPRVNGYPQGLHAIYSRACLDPIHTCITANRLKIIGFYGSVRVRYLDEPEYVRFDPQGLSFHNVNTPEELEKARKIMAADSQDGQSQDSPIAADPPESDQDLAH